MLPFTRFQFNLVFAVYNGVIWPLQWVAQLAGIVMLVMLARPTRNRDRINVVLLAAMWIWTGVVYHLVFFTAVNPAAKAFGVAFVLQGLVLIEAAWRRRLEFGTTAGLRLAVGWALVGYAVILYPALGLLLGERVLELPSFGLTPCPVVLMTLGMLVLAGPSVRWWMLGVPLAWALIGGSAAFLLQVPQDWPLLVAPLLLVALAAIERLQRPRVPSAA